MFEPFSPGFRNAKGKLFGDIDVGFAAVGFSTLFSKVIGQGVKWANVNHKANPILREIELALTTSDKNDFSLDKKAEKKIKNPSPETVYFIIQRIAHHLEKATRRCDTFSKTLEKHKIIGDDANTVGSFHNCLEALVLVRRMYKTRKSFIKLLAHTYWLERFVQEASEILHTRGFKGTGLA